MMATVIKLVPAATENAVVEALHDTNSNVSMYIANLKKSFLNPIAMKVGLLHC